MTSYNADGAAISTVSFHYYFIIERWRLFKNYLGRPLNIQRFALFR